MPTTELFTSLRFVFVASGVIINLLLAIGILRNNPKSATNVIFSILSVLTSAWLVIMHISLLPLGPEESLFWIRLSTFLAVPQSLCFFLLARTLPAERLNIKRPFLVMLILIAGLMMVLTLTPVVFRGIEVVEGTPHPLPGFGMVGFVFFVIFCSVGAVYALISKMRHSEGIERRQLAFVMIGTITMLGLIVLTILIPVVLFGINIFVAFAPLYTLVFLGTTAYAIVKHHLFNLKVIAAEALTILLWIMLFVKVVIATSTADLVVNALFLVGTVVFGSFLMRSVRKEVEQREELEKLADQLREANAKLEDLSRFKTQLLSLASHQIRAPLAAIKGFVQLLMDGSYGPLGGEKIMETLVKVKKSTNDLIDLISTLLDLRKLEEGRMEYQFVKTELCEMVSGIVESLRPLAMSKGLEFTAKCPENKMYVSADPQKLKQVIQNIIDNALKYTPTGFVRVETFEANHAAMITVTDSGLGIPPEVLPHLFSEFVRDERMKKQILGTGLGLFIAKKIIESHGGKVWAESKGPGKGSAFYITLQLMPDGK